MKQEEISNQRSLKDVERQVAKNILPLVAESYSIDDLIPSIRRFITANKRLDPHSSRQEEYEFVIEPAITNLAPMLAHPKDASLLAAVLIKLIGQI